MSLALVVFVMPEKNVAERGMMHRIGARGSHRTKNSEMLHFSGQSNFFVWMTHLGVIREVEVHTETES
jgi:hypothetical protein